MPTVGLTSVSPPCLGGFGLCVDWCSGYLLATGAATECTTIQFLIPTGGQLVLGLLPDFGMKII